MSPSGVNSAESAYRTTTVLYYTVAHFTTHIRLSFSLCMI